MTGVWPLELFFQAKDLFWVKVIPQETGARSFGNTCCVKADPVAELWRAWSRFEGSFWLLLSL